MFKFGMVFLILSGFIAGCDEINKDDEVGVEGADTASAAPLDHEVCNGRDDDADGEIDEADAWYTDADGDTYGSIASAGKDTGSASGLGDDGPGLSDASDTDSGVVDPELPEDTDGSTPITCEGGGTEGQVDNSDDCDDTNAAISPAASEVCDDVDNDCDGTADADATDAPTWYADGDGDGYGDATGSSYTACDPITGGDRSNAGDCDDGNSAVNPAATETCNAIDDDCDGDADDVEHMGPAESKFCWVYKGDTVGCEAARQCLSDPDTECQTSAECEAIHGGAPGLGEGVGPAM